MLMHTSKPLDSIFHYLPGGMSRAKPRSLTPTTAVHLRLPPGAYKDHSHRAPRAYRFWAPIQIPPFPFIWNLLISGGEKEVSRGGERILVLALTSLLCLLTLRLAGTMSPFISNPDVFFSSCEARRRKGQ